MTHWHVWFDWANDEFLAVEAEAMTPTLSTTLAREGTPVRETDAADRRTAVRCAFPEWFKEDPESGVTPAPRKRPH